MTVLGYQIPNFTYPAMDSVATFESVVAQAREADAAGFDAVTVMDHFYQLAGLGDPDQVMFECYGVLAALSQQTSTVRLGAMVTGNTYRNPAHLAKIVTTLDVMSGGRAMLNIGAGWFEREHIDYGYEFGTFGERFRKLEEALQIIIPMLGDERPSVEGEFYVSNAAINNPAPVSKIPVMIGGSGENKTLRMVAQYGDLGNLTCGKDEVPRKVDALAAHCARLERDRSEIKLSWLRRACIAPTMEQARAELGEFLGRQGLDYAAMDDDERAVTEAGFVFGDPDTVGETLRDDLDLGIDGYVLSLVANGHIPERVTLLGVTATAALG
jgi:F420-dependent oxidoreductase-like protein